MEFSQGLNYCQLGINICIHNKCLLPTCFKSGIFSISSQPGARRKNLELIGKRIKQKKMEINIKNFMMRMLIATLHLPELLH